MRKHLTVKELFQLADPAYMISYAAYFDGYRSRESKLEWLDIYMVIYTEMMAAASRESVSSQMFLLAERSEYGGLTISGVYPTEPNVRYSLSNCSHEQFLGLEIPHTVLHTYPVPYLASQLLVERGWYGMEDENTPYDTALYEESLKLLDKWGNPFFCRNLMKYSLLEFPVSFSENTDEMTSH